MKIIIPARKNSKGFKHKNRRLFWYTDALLYDLNKKYTKEIILDTDDDTLIEMAPDNYIINRRESWLAKSGTSTKTTLLHNPYIKKDDTIMVLYLTYPDRIEKHVEQAIKIFKKKNLKSLLCREPIKTHPYLTIWKHGNSKRWRQVIDHDFYQRQQYPECWEISHYISIFKGSELKKLNNNLYNDDTYFMEIPRVKDVDHEADL